MGLNIISGTRYPGTTNPESVVPNLRFSITTTKTPTHTVVITELLRAPVGKMSKGNILPILLIHPNAITKINDQTAHLLMVLRNYV